MLKHVRSRAIIIIFHMNEELSYVAITIGPFINNQSCPVLNVAFFDLGIMIFHSGLGNIDLFTTTKEFPPQSLRSRL